MTRLWRMGWVVWFMLLAVAAVWVNAGSRRIFILHEGRADQVTSRAFFSGADSVLRGLSHLKARHQYLGLGLDACRQALIQLTSFHPDAVIAEGPQARECVGEWHNDQAQRVFEPATGAATNGKEAFVAAWATLLRELVSGSGPVTLLHGDDRHSLAERDLLAQAATMAGFEVRFVEFKTSAAPDLAWTLPDALLSQTEGVLVLGRMGGGGATESSEKAWRTLFSKLHEVTSAPILSTRLDSVFWGADMALDEAPEQRGEQMALSAWRGGRGETIPPLEMAVALRSVFAERVATTLPQVYLASARLSGLLAAP